MVLANKLRTLALLSVLLSGCASLPELPNAVDAGISIVAIANGGVELNPLAIPFKIGSEAYGYSLRKTDLHGCVEWIYGARLSGCMGTGASLGMLAGPGVALAGMAVGYLLCQESMRVSAIKSCYYADETESTEPSIPSNSLGWNG